MNILVVGLNHKTASIELREQFALSTEDIENRLKLLLRVSSLEEAVIVSTCNRTEIYSYGSDKGALQDFFYQHCHQNLPLKREEFVEYSYCFEGMEAIKHLMRVACGLDSLVLGEPEILGQIKSAFSLACLHKTVGSQLSRLFHQTFHIAKRVRSSTSIGACPVSIASTAVAYVSQWWTKPSCPRILIVGVGDVGRVVAKHARSLSSHPLLIASRHDKNAERLAQDVEGRTAHFAQLASYFHEVDVVISATASQEIIISDAMVRDIKRPVLMLDLAVPRDISPKVVQNAYVQLCQLDDLKDIIQNHMGLRMHAAYQAEKIIDDSARTFLLSLRALDSEKLIKLYRASMERYSENELQKILHKNDGTNFEDKLRTFSRNLLNKIMHSPSASLRQASIEGRDDLLRSASEIFGIEEDL